VEIDLQKIGREMGKCRKSGEIGPVPRMLLVSNFEYMNVEVED